MQDASRILSLPCAEFVAALADELSSQPPRARTCAPIEQEHETVASAVEWLLETGAVREAAALLSAGTHLLRACAFRIPEGERRLYAP